MNPKSVMPTPPDDEPDAAAVQPRKAPQEAPHPDKTPREHPQGERLPQSDSDEDARSRRRDI